MYIDDKLVGIHKNIAEIELWLQDTSPNAVILFIHGMGGIGKTTISKSIYNSNYHEYDSSCFLADIHGKSTQDGGLLGLQRQLHTRILGSETKEVIWNIDEGIVKVTSALYNKKVLLILDDITTRKQLTALLGHQQFYPGSKVIITTRDKMLVNAFKIPPKILSMEILGTSDSSKLFSLYAFNVDHPIEPYIRQSKVVVHHCGGLPLALKILGSSLYCKTVAVWEDVMRKLEALPNPEIQKVLQLSYDTLEDANDKDVFLHIACFFVGEDKEFIVKLLDHCDLFPVVAIQHLIDGSLLYVECGQVMMHQLVKDMAQEVVRRETPKDPGKRSRLWNHKDTYDVLKQNSGTRKVEGLSLSMRKIKGKKRSYEDFSDPTARDNFKVGAIEKMKNLMLLQLDYATFSGSYRKLPKNLRLLRWHGLSLKTMPSDVPLDKLVVLDLRFSKLKKVWDGFKVVGSLKILNLSYSLELINTPDFGGLPSLESLLLEGCLSLTRVCESIGYLERLALLDVSDCRSLKSIPCLPISLVSLKVRGCSNLGGLQRAQCLDSCSLRSSLLVDIDVSACNLFDNSFPEDWSNLLSLTSLNISRNHITSLPGCIKTLPSLKKLYASNCSYQKAILDLPKSVKELDIYNNLSLEIVQPTPNPLTFLDARYCEKLRTVEGCFKVESIKKVDKKITRYLGLDGVEKQYKSTKGVPIKVSYEFGIFSTFVSGNVTLPCFNNYKESGSRVSFIVPTHPNGTRVTGLNVCFMFTSHFRISLIGEVEVNNKTKDVVWKYVPTIGAVRCERGKKLEDYVWLSLWRTGDLLEVGDEIVVRIIELWGYDDRPLEKVEECWVNLVYDDDQVGEEEETEETKDGFNQIISWNQRLLTEISDYVHTGKTYWFYVDGYSIGDIVTIDWWGIKPYQRSTHAHNHFYLPHSDLRKNNNKEYGMNQIMEQKTADRDKSFRP